jgi:hypothetical protein
MHFTPLALALAFESAGKSIPAKMAMMAMTTKQFNEGETGGTVGSVSGPLI